MVCLTVCCVYQISHKYVERRLLVAEACGAVASYLPVCTQLPYMMFVCECVCICVKLLLMCESVCTGVRLLFMCECVCMCVRLSLVCECVCMCVRLLLATKSEKWNGQPELACVSVQCSPLKTSECMVLHMPASREMMEQIDG